VVPDAVVVEPHLVEGLDRRLVVEERRHERRGADQVAGRDKQCVRVRRPECTDMRREVLDAARVAPGLCTADATARADRGLEVAVEVIETQDLDLGGLRVSGTGRRRGICGGRNTRDQ
jgi:hypothetical protein